LAGAQADIKFMRFHEVKLHKGDACLSALETIELLLGFGMFIIALITLIVDLLKNDKK
jgi:hypothetical protein